METAMPEPCGCPFSLRCSLPVPTWETHKCLQWLLGTGYRNMAVWHKQRAFSFSCGITTQVETQPLESKGKHAVTQAPQWQPLAGPPAGTGHWIPAVCRLSLCCPQGGEDAVKGKGKKAAPLPTCMANSSDGCLGVPSYRSIPMGRQPQGVESRTCDGPAPWFLLPHQPGTPGKTTQDLLLNYYRTDQKLIATPSKWWSKQTELLFKTHSISSRVRQMPCPFAW